MQPCSTSTPARWLLLAFALLLQVTWSSAVRAETSAAEKAVAETLFVSGKNLMLEGRYAEGCVKLEQSQAIEAAVGTMLYLAECYEKTERLASAWAMFREAASRASAEGQPDRAQTGAERSRQLEPRLSRLTVNVPTEHRVDGLRIGLDGNPLPLALLGTAIPVDGGTHTVTAEAPGYQSFSIQLSVADPAGSVAVQVPALTKTAAAAPVVAPAPAPSPGPAVPADEGVAAPRSNTQRIVALAVGGAGLLGIGGGVYFGLEAADTDDQAEGVCPRVDPCNEQRGIDLTEEAQAQALLANVLYGVGGAAVVAGVILYLTADDGSEGRARRPSAIALGRTLVYPDVIVGPAFSGASVTTEF